MTQLEHRADLPFCYYDKEKNSVVITLLSYDNRIASVEIVYGDPFDYETDKSKNDAWTWQYKTESLTKRMQTQSDTMWRVNLSVPQKRRLKYGFFIYYTDGSKKYYSERGLQEATEDLICIPHNHFVLPFVHTEDAPCVAGWVKDTIWYQIFPERFCNGDSSLSPKEICNWETDLPKQKSFFGGDLTGIQQKLAYIKDLGVTGIYLTPVFQAPSNHKYDTQDYYKVDPHFGDLQVLKDLVQKAHELGMKVMLDAVFNHIGATHPFWQDVLKNQEKSAYKDYFHIHSFPVQEKYDNYKKMDYDTFAFASSMPKWNTENKKAREYLINAAVYWIKECDIDAWRLDVADEVSFSFWKDFAQQVRGVKKDFYILGEVWYNASRWIHPGYFDACMNYLLGNAVADLFLTKKIDGASFMEKLFYAQSRYSALHNTVAFNLLDSHDTPRALTTAGNDKQAFKNAFAMLFLLPGSPSIYYGTEVGISGGKDPDCRRPMIWDEKKQDQDLLRFFKKLIALRKQYIHLIQEGSITFEEMEHGYQFTIQNQGEAIRIRYNTGKTEALSQENLIFTTAHALDELPPFTLAVYHMPQA